MADKCPKCGGKMEKGSCLAKASCGTHKADYDPRAGTGKPGMVIMIGVKGKKKDEKKKYGSAPMMKAWEQLVDVTYLGSYDIEER
jgi:hypothetical protein